MIEGVPYNIWKYNKILEKHLFMVRASDGTITVGDIDNMTLNDRNFYYERLLDIKQKEQKQLEELKSKKHK